MRFLPTFFHLRVSDRYGILWLLFILLALLTARKWLDPLPAKIVLDQNLIDSIQQQVDSLNAERLRERNRIFPFNPNFLSDYRAYMLGIPTESFDRLKAYREAGNWINSVADFKRVTAVPDSVLEKISPYFSFPEWTRTRNNKVDRKAQRYAVKEHGQKIDLNTASREDLMQVNGVGEALSGRIIRFRDRYRGLFSMDQLYGVYGLKPVVIQRIKERFKLIDTVPPEKLNINSASASDLSTIPGISFELGREIWEFVRLRDGIGDLSELAKLDEIDSLKLRLIALYLLAE